MSDLQYLVVETMPSTVRPPSADVETLIAAALALAKTRPSDRIRVTDCGGRSAKGLRSAVTSYAGRHQDRVPAGWKVRTRLASDGHLYVWAVARP